MQPFEDWLKAKGFELESVTSEQLDSLESMWRSETNPKPKPTSDGDNKPASAGLDEVLARHRAEQARETRITALVNEAVESHPAKIDDLEQIGRSAIKNKWTEQETELAILRACRASAPLPLGSNRHTARISDDVLEAGLAQAIGLHGLEAQYNERILTAADRHFKGGLGIQQLLHVAAQQHGYRGSAPVKSNLTEIVRYALTPRADSGVSNISVGGILSNVANKMMREAFSFVETAWRAIAAVASHSDFKQHDKYSLSGDLTFKKVAPAGFIQHGTLGETPYANQVDTYGIMLGIDRRDLINDDLGAFSQASRRIGRGGAIALNKVFWIEFLDNATFFSAGNGNLATPAAAPTIGALDDASELFRVQTDPDGNLMGVMPRILLVPASLAVTGANLMNSTIVVATGVTNTAQVTPNGNPFQGAYQLVTSAYLQDSTITGNSATAWYLLADPLDVPVIEVAFLNGAETPTVESASADFNQLGIQLRGFFDFGVRKQEFRGGVKNAGA